jgi:hypothetical protein
MPNQYVYIFSNELYPQDFLKIGWTRNHPSLRAQNLQTSGIPSPFTVEYVIVTSSGRSLEKKIHRHLDEYRVTPKREFFKINKTNLHDILTNNMNLNLITIDELDDHLGHTIHVDENVTPDHIVSSFLDEKFEPCEPNTGSIDKRHVSILFADWCIKEYGEIYYNKIQKVFDSMTKKYGELKEDPTPTWAGVQQIRDSDSIVLLRDNHFCECGKICKSMHGLDRHQSKCSVYQKLKSKQLMEMIPAFINENLEPCEPNPHDRLPKDVLQILFFDWYRKENGETPNDIQKLYDAMTKKFGERKKYPSPGWEGVRVITCDYSVDSKYNHLL